ncbi:ADP-ribosylglycohydrolase family protein [Chryseobacterium sp. NRRL B-14859]|uniref:ADP-ribosylglycohydrolase family protein n=1 Tax=Chryseobacterium sp. NRRL B-14859 TaxID=1562763 RepID=UPI00339519B6
MENRVKAGIFGLCIGDALGVPVEFKSRDYLKQFPVTKMLEFGSHHQPKGTWSDDSSMTLCLAEELIKGYNLEKIGQSFVKWNKYGHWTAHGRLFDIGVGTREAIARLIKGESARFSGNIFEEDNGNGSLMRILPLAFYCKEEENIEKIYQTVKEVSSITHGHFRSVFACFIYVIFAIQLINRKSKTEAYVYMQNMVLEYAEKQWFNSSEIELFHRILKNDISVYPEDEIKSGGYVLHSLEASLWCFFNAETYSEAVLKAVNLGEDTDTTGAITGGLAGIYYGLDGIPQEWISELVRKDDIEELCNKLERKLDKGKSEFFKALSDLFFRKHYEDRSMDTTIEEQLMEYHGAIEIQKSVEIENDNIGYLKDYSFETPYKILKTLHHNNLLWVDEKNNLFGFSNRRRSFLLSLNDIKRFEIQNILQGKGPGESYLIAYLPNSKFLLLSISKVYDFDQYAEAISKTTGIEVTFAPEFYNC